MGPGAWLFSASETSFSHPSQLRRIFRAIQAIKSQSGWSWSDTRGADITPEMEHEWVKFIKVYKDAKPFKNRGWIYLERMSDIMPVTLRGTYVFRPSQGMTGMNSAPRSPSPEWDIERPEGELPSSDDGDGPASEPSTGTTEVSAVHLRRSSFFTETLLEDSCPES